MGLRFLLLAVFVALYAAPTSQYFLLKEDSKFQKHRQNDKPMDSRRLLLFAESNTDIFDEFAKEADVNGDNKLSPKEYKKFIENHFHVNSTEDLEKKVAALSTIDLKELRKEVKKQHKKALEDAAAKRASTTNNLLSTTTASSYVAKNLTGAELIYHKIRISKHNRTVADELFESIDANSDEKISVTEMIEFNRKHFNYTMSDKEAKETMRKYREQYKFENFEQPNITYEEFHRSRIANLTRESKPVLSATLANATEVRILKEKINMSIYDEKIADEIFHLMDLNLDGKIDIEESIKFARKLNRTIDVNEAKKTMRENHEQNKLGNVDDLYITYEEYKKDLKRIAGTIRATTPAYNEDSTLFYVNPMLNLGAYHDLPAN